MKLRNKIVLASRSPRRAMLLRQLDLFDVEILPSGVDESLDHTLLRDPPRAAAALARRKGQDVAARRPRDLVVAADTMVVCGGEIFNKPRDNAEAAAMLSALSGRTHAVYTGLYLHRPERPPLECAECTLVTFRTLTQEEIDWYVATGEPADKAGAYGAQEKGALFIERVEGDYTTVVGLPLCRLGIWLRRSVEFCVVGNNEVISNPK